MMMVAMLVLALMVLFTAKQFYNVWQYNDADSAIGGVTGVIVVLLCVAMIM